MNKKPTLKQLLIARKARKEEIKKLRREIYKLEQEIEKKL